ncbi:ephrin-A4 isoform X2 [Tachyglossus aculeatus]|uniref:ephrin-A4 isoform X2 n=1 Tax=Tachyglossus aculeatus TaxID=9261 RepID=UPI0018F60ECA|nr:ephrin-A4 isoform X2 [Tachyglossus aculeatus]
MRGAPGPLVGAAVLWAALLGGLGLRHTLYWNSTNPRLQADDPSVELGLNDYLDIFCPHYEGPAPPGGPETFALFMVDAAGYAACRPAGPNAFKRWECGRPFAPLGPVRFSEKIQRFTPFSLGFEFIPGNTYHYISDNRVTLVPQVLPHGVGETPGPGGGGTPLWPGGRAPGPLCILLLLLLPLLRLLRGL